MSGSYQKFSHLVSEHGKQLTDGGGEEESVFEATVNLLICREGAL
jgi:hypothetical protein